MGSFSLATMGQYEKKNTSFIQAVMSSVVKANVMPMNPSTARVLGETLSPSDHFDLGSPINEPLAQVQIAPHSFLKLR